MRERRVPMRYGPGIELSARSPGVPRRSVDRTGGRPATPSQQTLSHAQQAEAKREHSTSNGSPGDDGCSDDDGLIGHLRRRRAQADSERQEKERQSKPTAHSADASPNHRGVRAARRAFPTA